MRECTIQRDIHWSVVAADVPLWLKERRVEGISKNQNMYSLIMT